MKRLLSILIFFSTLYAEDVASPVAEPKQRVDMVETRDYTMEQAEEMIKKAMNDLRKFDRRKIRSTIIIQGDLRSYPAPFYNMVRETVISELNKLEDIKINFVAKLPRVIIKGTPDKLSIAKTNEKDIEKIALKSDAKTIFLWNLFEYNNEMNFIARIINTESKAVMWHYKVNREVIKNDKLVQAAMVKYNIPKDYYIAAGVSTYFTPFVYEREGVTASDTLTANWILGTDILYSTQSSVSPRLRLGAGATYIGSGAPALAFSIVNLYVDVRYQFNEFIPPLYDASTGRILQRRNHQSLMIGGTFGRALSIADEQKAGGVGSVYLNLGISHLVEVNVGLTVYVDAALTYNSSATYKNNTVGLGYTNMFFNVKYKFNFNEEEQ